MFIGKKKLVDCFYFSLIRELRDFWIIDVIFIYRFIITFIYFLTDDIFVFIGVLFGVN